MRTVEDLREALASCEQPPPPLEHFLRGIPPSAAMVGDGAGEGHPAGAWAPPRSVSGGPGLRGRRGFAAAGAAAAAVIVVVGGLALSGPGGGPAAWDAGSPVWPVVTQGPPSPPVTAGVPPAPIALDLDFVVPAAGYRLTRRSAGRGYGQVMLSPVAPLAGPDIYVTVYRRGAYEPTEAKANSPVEVDGRAGYYGPLDGAYGPHAVLAWEYEPDAWALVSSSWPDGPQHGGSYEMPDAVFRTTALAIADAVHIGAATAVPLSFRIGYLPPGLVPNWVFSGDEAAEDEASVQFADDLPTSRGTTTDVAGSPVEPSALEIDLTVAPDQSPPCEPTDTLISVGRYQGCALTETTGEMAWSLEVPSVGQLGIRVDANHRARYPEATVGRIIESLRFPPKPTDQSTWFDARFALPAR